MRAQRERLLGSHRPRHGQPYANNRTPIDARLIEQRPHLARKAHVRSVGQHALGAERMRGHPRAREIEHTRLRVRAAHVDPKNVAFGALGSDRGTHGSDPSGIRTWGCSNGRALDPGITGSARGSNTCGSTDGPNTLGSARTPSNSRASRAPRAPRSLRTPSLASARSHNTSDADRRAGRSRPRARTSIPKSPHLRADAPRSLRIRTRADARASLVIGTRSRLRAFLSFRMRPWPGEPARRIEAAADDEAHAPIATANTTTVSASLSTSNAPNTATASARPVPAARCRTAVQPP